jgi:hypothetical protein
MLDGVRISNFIRGFPNPWGFGFPRGFPLGDNHIEAATKIDKHKITKMSNIGKKVEINLPNKNWSEFHPKQNKKINKPAKGSNYLQMLFISSMEHPYIQGRRNCSVRVSNCPPPDFGRAINPISTRAGGASNNWWA